MCTFNPERHFSKTEQAFKQADDYLRGKKKWHFEHVRMGVRSRAYFPEHNQRVILFHYSINVKMDDVTQATNMRRSRQKTSASATLGGVYEWTGNIWVYPAGWLRSRAEKISTYSMIHHNKVFGRGWWCHRWRWWGVICESERKKKRRRWRRKRIRKRGE